jgi:AraC-like DNA-binding protein
MTTMLQGGDFAAVPELGYEEWRAVVRSIVGRYSAEGTDPNAFSGRVHVRSLFGLVADRWDHNAHRIERTQRDARLDDVELYHAVFQVFDVAAEAGISLRYLQKLFTQSGSTCSGFIDSLRLDKAGRLLRRRSAYSISWCAPLLITVRVSLTT